MPDRQEPLHHVVRGSLDYACAVGRLPRFRGRLAAFELAAFARKIQVDGNREHAKAARGCARHDGKGRCSCERRGRGS